MSLLSASEREEFLKALDIVFMAKIMEEEGLSLGTFEHHKTTTEKVLSDSLSLLFLEKYPYCQIRPSKNKDRLFILTVSLPRSLKPFYQEFKFNIEKIFDTIECYYGESFSDWHYNELHIECSGTVFYHEVLQSIIQELKKMKQKETIA